MVKIYTKTGDSGTTSLFGGKRLSRVQKELFVLGSDLSAHQDVKVKIPRITKAYIARLEKEIDRMEMNLPRLKNFILPGGSPIGSKLHLARSVARRAERSIVAISEKERINQNAQVYINRLSDWLFVLARYVNKQENQKENIWKGRK